MILDLRGIEDFPASVSLTAGPESFSPFAEGVTQITQIRVDLTIQQTGEEFFCQARVVGQVSIECARCLAEFPLELVGRTNFIVTDNQTRVEGKMAEDSEEYILMNGDQVADLDILVQQELLLAMPMKPVCDENCKGLCPRCGVNWNNETCGCKVVPTDSRWQGLSDLLNDN
jgi:uncharacterized protein